MAKSSFISMSTQPLMKKSILPQKYMGFVYALLGHFAMCISGFIIKKSQSTLSSSQVQFFLSIQMAIYSYIFCSKQNISIIPKSPNVTKLLLARAVLGFIGTITYILALKYLPLSEAIVINNTLPVFAGLFAALLLGEQYDKSLVINTAMSIIGVVFVSKPSFLFTTVAQIGKAYEFRQFGLLCILISTILGGITVIVLKKLGGAMNPAVTVFYFGAVNTFISTISLIVDGQVALDLKSCIALVMIGFAWTIGQALQNIAYKFGEASRIVVVMYSQVVFSFMFEIIFDGIMPDGFSILGASCIISGFFVILYKISKQEILRRMSRTSISSMTA